MLIKWADFCAITNRV